MKDRRYSLEPYALEAEVLSAEEVCKVMNTRGLGSKLLQILGRQNPRKYQEQNFHFDAVLLEQKPPLYLDGYWQSERYFLQIRTELQAELTIDLSGANASLASAISQENAVAVHVRRGDYLSSMAASKFHGTCPSTYYRQAAEVIEQKVGPVHYYLFGDDPEWTKDNLFFLQPATIVTHNSAAEAHLDLELMRRCNHHIIANSTLSWWGAWLSDAESKTVIAPSRWFLDTSVDTRDLIPASWHRL
jgi:hypothetical protein